MKKRFVPGATFGRWVLVSLVSHDKENHRYYWMCRCICGTTRVVVHNSLINGRSASCGCKTTEELRAHPHHKTHGDSKRYPHVKEYRVWCHMKERCYNPKAVNYENYGGRGIHVCNRWLHSYENFLIDVGRAPSPKYTIDRIDSDGNYAPGNIRWATTLQQHHNRRKAA